MLALPALSAGSTQPGENGRIVFASGRDATDATARLYLLPVPGSTGGATVSPPITDATTLQHRHPTWSPDRTKIAYARGDSATANFDIFVQDLTDPTSTPVNITNSNNVTDDRPAWSPDGTKIAYQSEVVDGSLQTDVLIQDAPNGGNVTNFTNTANVDGKQFEGRPAWSSNGAALFYEKGINPNTAANGVNIVQKALSGGSET